MKYLNILLLALFMVISTAGAQVVQDQYIVVLNDNAPSSTGQAIAAQHGVQVGHEYSVALKGFSFHGNAKAAAAIAQNPNVAYVEANLEAHAVAQPAPNGIQRIGAAVNVNGLDNRVDVAVAVIDTGIDLDHPDLPPVVGGRHYYTVAAGRPRERAREDNNYDDDNGHGTHVAGTIAALDNNFGVVGVVPGARLWAIKVLDSNGSGTFADVIKGIDFVAANVAYIDVANMSLTGQGRLNSLRTAIQNSVAAGVVYVVAAGNDSLDVYGPDGSYNSNDDIIPAAYPEVITVSAMGDTDGIAGGLGTLTSYLTGDDTFSSFTNYSDTPGAIDLAGPGVDVYSTYVGGGYVYGSGTSMASPHVAGLAALYRSEHSGASVADVRQALIDSAEAQAVWGPADTFDPDNNAEGLAVVASPGVVNDAPVVMITSPDDGDTFSSGASVTLGATATDTEDGNISADVSWSSNIDGALDTSGGSSVVLTDGVHLLIAAVIDSGGKTSTDSIFVTVGDPPEVATISTVDSIDYETYGGRQNNRSIRITLTILDDFGAPIEGAVVDIELHEGSTTYFGTGGVTASDGTVVYTLRKAPSGTYTTLVTDVQATDLTWDGNTPANSFPKP